VLDIGGGHGWYSAQLCARHPQLTATVLDLPGSAAIGREIIAKAGLAERSGTATGTPPPMTSAAGTTVCSASTWCTT
jgi:hypothetical protein